MVPYLEMGGSNVFLYRNRSEEHTSELQSPVPISYAVFCLKKKKKEENEKNVGHNTPNINYERRKPTDKHTSQDSIDPQDTRRLQNHEKVD